MLVFINGKFFAEKDAKISVKDRGFRFADSVFETISVHNGVPYLFNEHMKRLDEGLKALRIKKPAVNLREISERLIKKNKFKKGFLRIAVTRGIGSRGYLPTGSKPSVVMEVIKRPKMARLANLWLAKIQKVSASALPVSVKYSANLNSVLARIEAAENHCMDALLLGSEKQICETSTANIFWFKGSKLYTPSLKAGILPGIIRKRIIELMPTVEGIYYLEDLSEADEVFVTNVFWPILPVKEIQPVNMKWNKFPRTLRLLKVLEDDIKKHALKGKK